MSESSNLSDSRFSDFFSVSFLGGGRGLGLTTREAGEWMEVLKWRVEGKKWREDGGEG